MRFGRRGKMRIEVSEREAALIDEMRKQHPELIEEPEKKKKTFQQWLDEPVLGG